MVRRKNRMRDVSIEEMDAWSASVQNFKECSEAADEEGGPRLSFVPQPKLLKLEILPDEVDAPPDQLTSPATLAPKLMAVPFAPEPSRKVGGWSASRQHLFVGTLAETGSVHLAAKSPGCRRAVPMPCASARPPSPARGMPASSSPSGDCRRWCSTARSMAGSNKCGAATIWSARSACRPTDC